MKCIFLYIGLFVFSVCTSQNLVPNPSFESYSVCPSLVGQIESAIPWTAATTDNSSTDYYNICASAPSLDVPYNQGGFQYPRTGNAYAGLAFCLSTGQREYLQIHLSSPLVQNIVYYVEFYVNSSNANVNSNCNNIAANLAIVRPYTTTQGVLQQLIPHIMIPGNPIVNDTINWVQVSGCYTSQGGEEYLTIGNFFDNTNTQVGVTGASYYYVDDVRVEAVTGVCVNGVNELSISYQIQVYPNPTSGDLKITITNFSSKEKLNIKIIDVIGREVMNDSYKEEFDISGLQKGIYFVSVYRENQLLGTRKIVKK